MDFMRRALRLARKALGTTSPNPAVGAVVVKDGQVVGEGHTLPPGQGHAEAVALRRAGGKARGAVLYTTLEPCAHHGRVPPCAPAIIQAGVAEVRIAMIDPNPLVNGRGKTHLEAAGVRCIVGEHEWEAQELNEAYVKHVTTGLPFVTAKFAMSLDGKIAARTGESRWITGAQARRYAHTLRRRSDAMVIGVNTVLADDPRLTARDARDRAHNRQPLRVVVDSHGRTSPTARMLREPGWTIIATTPDISKARTESLRAANAEVLELPARDGLVDLQALLETLGKRDITSVLVEGGGTLLGSFFDLGLVDKVAAFVAPVIIGGREAPSPVEGSGVASPLEGLRLRAQRLRRLGEDLLITGYVAPGGNECSAAS